MGSCNGKGAMTEEQFEELKNYIREVDVKALVLGTAIDTMQTSLKLVVNMLESKTVEPDVLLRVCESACKHLKQIEGSIVINKNRTLSTICNFIDFITSIVKLSGGKRIKKHFDLEIRKYLKEHGISGDSNICGDTDICEVSQMRPRNTYTSKGKSAKPDERTRLNKESKDASVYGGKVKKSMMTTDDEAGVLHSISDYEEDFSGTEFEIKYKSRISKLEFELSEVQNELKAKEDECQSLRKQTEELASLQVKFDQKKDELNQMVITLQNMNEQIDTLLKSREALKEDIESKEKLSKMTIEELQIKVTSVEEENRRLEENNKSLTTELERMQMIKSLRVQVFSQRQSDTMSAVEKEIICHLEKQIKSKNSDVKFVQCATQGDVDQNLPTLLLCANASRLGTEASNILHGFKANSKMALVIVHHKDIHALPKQASNRVLVGQEFKDLGEIFDVAFLVDKGIYKCDMNEENISRCVHFITNCL